MMKKRLPKAFDELHTETAYLFLKNLINENLQIEPTLWLMAIWSTLVDGYISQGATHDQFVQECNRACEHYKSWFNARKDSDS